MFQSVPRRSLCEMSALRCPSARSFSRSVESATAKLKETPWLKENIGLLLTWLQRAGGSTGGSGEASRCRGLLSILADHCGFVTGQRLRRAWQVGQLYSNIYSDRTKRNLVGTMWRTFQSRHSSGRLLAALAGVFMWDSEKIQDDEIQRCGLELQALDSVTRPTSEKAASFSEQDWEIVMDKKDFKVWRRPVPDSHLYEYRVLGSYNDVTPRQFFNVQLDTEYRKTWDALVIKLEVVDRDAHTGSEVVHWATHFPYPMYSRDYVYVRRYDVDVEKNLMILMSRAVEHPKVPESQEFVRVNSYQSKMVIRPHSSFDENGFDYLLTYSDDPQTAFPRYCVSWMVSSGMPDFLDKLHTAAVRAKNLEVGIYDYAGVKTRLASPERRTEDSHTGTSGQIYA
ncbi:unnamed protein product [Knipowitschia caucasica]